MTNAGRAELILIIFMMVFMFLFGCAVVYFFIRQYRREKLAPKTNDETMK